jgi:hypothetical protein
MYPKYSTTSLLVIGHGFTILSQSGNIEIEYGPLKVMPTANALFKKFVCDFI